MAAFDRGSMNISSYWSWHHNRAQVLLRSTSGDTLTRSKEVVFQLYLVLQGERSVHNSRRTVKELEGVLQRASRMIKGWESKP